MKKMNQEQWERGRQPLKNLIGTDDERSCQFLEAKKQPVMGGAWGRIAFPTEGRAQEVENGPSGTTLGGHWEEWGAVVQGFDFILKITKSPWNLLRMGLICPDECFSNRPLASMWKIACEEQRWLKRPVKALITWNRGGGKADGEKWSDLRNSSQMERRGLAEGLDVEGESEKKEGIKDDSYTSGLRNWVSGGLVVPLTELVKSRRKTCWQGKECVRGCRMSREFSLKPVKFEIYGRYPGRDVREAVRW